VRCVALVLFFAAMLLTVASAQALVELRHAHGLGFSADGSRILVPDHFGIAVYSAGRWSRLPAPSNDYMGFAVTRDFLFSSGHAPGSRGRSNPLGLIRSGDGGRSWTSLGFAGEAEFHMVAAGYASNMLYVYNPAPNSRMPRAGIYQMLGDGLGGWRSAHGRGLPGELGMLAVHPTETGTIAAATTAGLFLSRDGGDEFTPMVAGARATAVRFTLDGDALLFGTYDGAQPGLFRIAIRNGLRQQLALPPFGRDAVANIAQNPVRSTEFALITFERAVFLSSDAGKSWKRIARARGTLP
jgi:hypothetical protein